MQPTQKLSRPKTSISKDHGYIWKPCNNVSVIVALNSKGGENDPDSTAGDHIKDLLLDSYEKIMETIIPI